MEKFHSDVRVYRIKVDLYCYYFGRHKFEGMVYPWVCKNSHPTMGTVSKSLSVLFSLHDLQHLKLFVSEAKELSYDFHMI